MTAFGNVAFAVILMDAFNQFMPGVFTDGNNPNSIICGSVLIWGCLLYTSIDASRFQPELFNLSCQSQVCLMAL